MGVRSAIGRAGSVAPPQAPLEAVEDLDTRAKLTPTYTLGCKRPSFHNTYLPTFNRPNVALETTPIDRR